MADIDIDQRLRDIQKEYLDFLDDDSDQGVYSQLAKDLILRKGRRMLINVNDLRKKNPVRCQSLLNSSFEEFVAFQRALKELISAADPTYAKDIEEFFIALEGSFGSRHVTPRTLVSSYLGNVVCVEGIVTKCSIVRPKIVRSVHYCPATAKTMERRYTDLTTYDAYPSSSVYPTKDEDGNLLETEYGLSVYKNHQTFSIQEMPEKAPAGQLPRNVDIIADNDLVDKCKPGDRVQVVGMFRCLPSKKMGYTTGTFRTILIANNIQLLSKEVSPQISVDDVKKCKKFSKQKNVFDILAHSLAPSIHGNEYIKKAILCLLLGGVEKVLPNGTRLRGDINVLLLGDPSVAKSQLLRYVLHTAPRAITTTGRGSSGVGLTAAVTTDQETGDRRLEAGAMVLADRGVVCIDEFDKMSDIDRTAIHEVMEQGRVTIAKAGIQAKLNARCSVLAAANPVYGKYDQYKTPMENIGLQDSLLSRFDLLFIMLDKMDPECDREIADHVVRMHRYRKPGEMDGEPLPIHSAADFLATKDPDSEDEQDGETPIFEKFDALLHGSRAKMEKVVSIEFMKKYIHLAKAVKPILTKEACEILSEEYTKLRAFDTQNSDIARTQPVTARSLETLIRLSTAHAKARMSNTVSVKDAQSAISLVQYAYFKKVMEKEKKRRRHDDSSSDEETEEAHKKKKSTKPRPKPGEEGYDPFEFDDVEGAQVASSQPSSGTTQAGSSTMDTSKPSSLSDSRMKDFRSIISKLFKERHAQSVPIQVLNDYVSEQETEHPFTPEEINTALDAMTEANQLMVANEIVFLI
ncbi:zygotic DNA replication licensing factor mcm3 isoform X1 [Parasteatoda tepidariorum]|uniref:zygotic DNA replication licensing factor mcm3 isoform X1 n=1 Tax=Parasteatoda tepidariorum TaxID=114398 RepID=UPI001C727B82|nr:zygotic DNA replication licensing factor mcm3 isoform X1 [Parasteatoda tepidariorum]